MSNFNAFVESASNNNTTAPKFFRFNLLNDTIEGSEFNFKKAGNPTSEQYVELMKMKATQPTFKFAPIASTKKVEKKQTYAGLTFDLMMDYVEIKGTDTIKAEFEEIVNRNSSYPTIKSWFLDYFKAGFTVEKAKREIEAAKKKAAQAKLKETKAKVRATVRAKTVKATSAVLEMPTAQNF